VEKFYQSVLEDFPGVAKIVRQQGHLSLEEYSDDFFRYRDSSIQPIGDFIEVTGTYARRLLGEKIAGLLERHFTDMPVVLTANHHGVGYKALSVHGTIIFALSKILNTSGDSLPVVPVLACGIVPLSNYTFPRGIALSREIQVAVSSTSKVKTFLKVPVIPNKYSHSLVSVSGPITRQMVSKVLKIVERLFQEGTILESEKRSLVTLLREEYAKPDILALSDYSDQSVVLNRAVWKRMFAPPLRDVLPEMVCLEMERVVAALLEKDIGDPGSLLFNILFDQSLRKEVLHSLDCHSGCWNLKILADLSNFALKEHSGSEEFRGCGTVFFCSVDEKGRRVPLRLSEGGSSPPVLLGISGERNIRFSLTPDTIRKGLRERRLLPGLFVNFAVLAFARGIKCIGGFFQADYLPAMQKSLIQVLESRGIYDWAQKIARVPTANFVTGMNIATALYPDGVMAPAGAIEIIAGGGLSREDLELIKTLSVREANFSGILEIYPETVLREKGKENWPASLKREMLVELRKKLVLIRL